MTPGWVLALHDYWRWVEDCLDSSGGYLAEDYLAVDVVEPDQVWLALIVGKQRLIYPDGSYLDFRFTVGQALELVAYNFQYARFDGQLVWRLDKHRGHEPEDGGDTHIHHATDERKPHEAVDLADVLEKIWLDQQDDRRPS